MAWWWLLVPLVALVACGDDGGTTTPSTSTPTTTSTLPAGTSSTVAPTTTVAGCSRLDGASVQRRSGPGAIGSPPFPVLLQDIQVEASACTDVVVFGFAGGTPGWDISYQDGPFRLDPSDLPVDIAGSDHLVVRLEPASGIDQSTDPVIELFTVDAVATQPPSGIAAIRRLGDYESVTTWVLGLDGRAPFRVIEGADHLIVELVATTQPRDATCASASGWSVTAPAGWFVYAGGASACGDLGPSPWFNPPGTDDIRSAVTLRAAEAPFAEVVDGLTAPSWGRVLASEAMVVDGRMARYALIEANGTGMEPEGWVRAFVAVDAPGGVLMATAWLADEPGLLATVASLRFER